MKIIVFGGGRIGSFIARELAIDNHVTVIDPNCHGIPNVQTLLAYDYRNIADDHEYMSQFDVAINALPDQYGYSAMHAIIQSKTNCIDITFMGQDFFDLDELAKKNGVTVFADFGVAPGLAGMMVSLLSDRFSNIQNASIMVGGMPFEGPYKAPFSPATVVQEYVRPARIKRNGVVIEIDPLSNVETAAPGTFFGMNCDLEYFATDGLRSLLRINVPNMTEYTVRKPGEADRMRVLREYGILDDSRLVDLVLADSWHMKPGTQEFTVMNVGVDGIHKNGMWHRVVYRLFDKTAENGDTSMARTTGIPAIIAAKFIGGCEPGVHAGENMGSVLVEQIIDEMRERGVIIGISEYY